ncbi:hypothetical protein [Mucilaginibacter auburnensis]|uniref:Peptidase S74 domain-containing protein n=1 Tax=Mucilaginibacter auburnensis TaxID=1457233 RepID=A0A2H9VPM0_9SPHI|nr:hypothetical protein [Mucilaginibacter auburnensis]PJJ80283.1 hypothetical protein CLV57_3433 [Mucilaginibacter auburnensis]
MKKTCLSIFALLAASQFSYAQWTTTTTAPHTNNTNSGNVGINIGTTTPIMPLTVGDVSGIVQKYSSTPYFLIKGGVDTYLQTVGSAANNWSRAALSTNIHWNNTAGNWRVDGGAYSDFSSMNFENTGNIAFYSRSTTGTSYDITHADLSAFKRLNIAPDGIVSTTGRFGVGTASPISAFQVGNGVSSLSIGSAAYTALDYGTSYIGFNAARSNGNWQVGDDGSNNGGGVIYSNVFGDMYFAPITSTGTGGQTLTDMTVKSKIAFHITRDGLVRAKKIKVELTNWPDFVFRQDYKLPTLSEVKEYIDKNQHLPDMPSAEEIETNGLDLGEMNRLLVKKVEELTLYLIDKDRQVEMQNKQLKNQEDRLQKLEDLLLKKDNNK